MERCHRLCPACETPMQRTGRTRAAHEREGITLYRVEYACPQCGQTWRYDERSDNFLRGAFEDDGGPR